MGTFLETHGSELNERQLAAVSQTEGPVLVLAGAGSGKTRVLTYRIAHLIYDHYIPLDAILAMTFSNKAAREMHERVKHLLGDEGPARLPWISTFHSVCARILRLHGGRLGYTSDFAIYDDADQKSLMKDCMEKAGISDKEIAVDTILHQIGEWKNKGKFFDEVESLTRSSFEETCAKLYKTYTEEMKKVQAMDFDDLLLNTYRLFKEHPDVKNFYQDQWRYILIDEFQDTNELQYNLLREMMNSHRNICVVGDDDQSIYGWRGAKIENILEFDKEFKGAKVVKLEQNYRSTGNILKAATAIISKNQMRHEKTLWTNASDGQKIRLASLEDDREEAHFIVGEMKRLMEQGVSASEIAVLYRVNSLSRGFEEECLRYRIPYQIIGGFRFYERKEIKDILSYLKILLNPSDIMAFRRTINTPLRGIGATSVEKLEGLANISQNPIGVWISQWDAIPITGKARDGISQYRDIMAWGLSEVESRDSLVDLLIDLLKKTKYVEVLEKLGTEESKERVQNIEELLSAVQQFEENFREPDVTEGSLLRRKLRAFLEQVSLMSDIDGLYETAEKVTMMSLHAAKGLEFKVCFLAGMEEGLFPSARSYDSYEKTEEERRLCYVGMTRAKEKLYLTRAERRRVFGSINFCVASRFLKDVPMSAVETVREPAESSGSDYAWRPRIQKSAAQSQFANDFDFDQRVQSDEDFSFRKGERVVHPSFGEGIVQKAEFLGADECLSIAFARRGLKKVLSKFVTKL
ncbi:MAG: ATP-dependent helicase PcrA [Bacteriovoracaceae bacterium]|nr:ATP-dependent helicase PcrA [Bacteriovoracaceae bacterium]